MSNILKKEFNMTEITWPIEYDEKSVIMTESMTNHFSGWNSGVSKQLETAPARLAQEG